ncbi:hypothetical protein Tco_1257790 [Tanacetum coccineum]
MDPMVSNNAGQNATNKDSIHESNVPSHDSPIVLTANINVKPIFYAGAAGLQSSVSIKGNANFRSLVSDNVYDGVDISISVKVVETISIRLEHTLYGYFIGKRLPFPVPKVAARSSKNGNTRGVTNSNARNYAPKQPSNTFVASTSQAGQNLNSKFPVKNGALSREFDSETYKRSGDDVESEE